MKTLLKLLSLTTLIALTTLGCKKEPAVGEPKLNIPEHQRSITISRDAQTVTIDVESNRIWEIDTFSTSTGWFAIVPASLEGEGNGQIRIAIRSNPAPALQRELELIIRTIGGISRQVIITQEGEEPIPTTLIYADNFGVGGPQSGTGLSITEFQGFNREGTSAASVYYTSEGGTVDLRSGQPSTGYRGASGGNNVFFATAGGASFIINGIVPDDYQNFFLSFGTNQNHDTISVEFSTDDGATWTPTSFSKPETGWGLVEIAFTIPQGVDSIKLKFTAGRTQFGARIDDVRLEGVDGEVQPGAALSISPSSLNIPTAGDSRDISITSNTNWTATSNADWASVSTPSGNGNYTLTVEVLENTGAARQTTVTIATTDGTISRTLNISQDGLFLSISTDTLSFGINANSETFNITSNVGWTIISSQPWATSTPGSGSNNQTITVAVTENETGAVRSATLTISANGLPDQTVTIQQSNLEEPVLILADDFGTGATGNPFVNNYTGWNRTGISASTVSYSGTGASVRTTGASSGYPGASGGNNVMFAGFAPGTTEGGGGTFTISGIEPGNRQNFQFSFGTNQTSTVINVYFSVDGGANWTKIDFNKTTTSWGLVETTFSIPEIVTSFNMRITGEGTSGGARIDDIRLIGN